MISEAWQIDAIWLTIAFLSGIAVKQIKLPPLIGFLATGFILNATGLTEGHISEILETISDLGVMLLLFTIGLKIKVKNLIKKEVWLTSSLHMLISVIICGGFVFLLSTLGLEAFGGLDLKTSALIGFALSFSSTVFVVKILEEKGELNSFHGKIAIGILVMQDIFAVAFISLSAGKWPSLWALVLIPLLYVVQKILYRLLNSIGHGELLTIFGFFSTFTVGAVSFSLVGLKPDLGALVIGMLLVEHPKSDELYDRMMGFKDFFLIAFFVNIGLSGQVNTVSLLIAALILPLIFVKGGFFLWILSRFDIRPRTAFHASLSLANYSEFGLIVGMIAYKNGMIDLDWLVAMAVLMSLSFLISSPLNRRAHDLFDRFKPQIVKLRSNYVCQDEEPVNLGDSEYIVVSLGTMGVPAYQYLNEHYPGKVLGMDYNHDKVEACRNKGMNAIWCDTTDLLFWQNADFSKVKMILFAMSDFHSNVNSIKELNRSGKKTFQVGVIYHYPEEKAVLEKLGVDFTYSYKDRVGKDFAQEFLEQHNAQHSIA
jgi:predicted Kef-type K+ transport protein